MKIVLFVRSLGAGGAERQLVLLATQLASRHEVAIVTFYEPDDLFKAAIGGSRARLISLGKKGRWDLIGFLGRFARTMDELKPDVIYAFMNTASIVALRARFGRPRPRIVWGIRSSNMELIHYGFWPRALRRIECWLSRFADLAISNSNAGRERAIADGYRTAIVVVPNGIDTATFSFNPQVRDRLRRAHGVPEDATVIGTVARHDPMKGYPTFLEAASLHRARNANTYFVSVGEGPSGYTRDLKAMAEKLGLTDRMLWIGRTNVPADWYSAMDLFTSASAFGEGFSNAIGEAMACGLTCVVTDVGDARRIVEDLGVVVPALAPKALAEGWDVALRESRNGSQQRRADVRERIRDNFSDERMVKSTETILLQVHAGSPVEARS
jgi:glycosyltransferase involved in cell wall biosynthesis